MMRTRPLRVNAQDCLKKKPLGEQPSGRKVKRDRWIRMRMKIKMKCSKGRVDRIADDYDDLMLLCCCYCY